METFEATELIPVGDEQHRRLVSIQELLDELRDCKQRLAKLEKFREKYFYTTAANRRSKGPVGHSSELEVGSGGVNRVGHGEQPTSLLADVEQDFVTLPEGDAEDSSLYQVAAAVREHALCAEGD